MKTLLHLHRTDSADYTQALGRIDRSARVWSGQIIEFYGESKLTVDDPVHLELLTVAVDIQRVIQGYPWGYLLTSLSKLLADLSQESLLRIQVEFLIKQAQAILEAKHLQAAQLSPQFTTRRKGTRRSQV